jgi:hypothetical protein
MLPAKNRITASIIYCCAIIAGALLLMIPAFYNGYPIANPDTGTYMDAGFKLETPFDRPMMYGLLLRLFSINGFSLWLTVFMQAFIVSWLVSRVIKHYSNRENYLRYFLFIMFFLSVFTGLSWVASELIADIYTPVCMLCIAVLLTGKEKRDINILLGILYFASVATHFSHMLIFSLLLVLLLLLRKYIFYTKQQAKTALVLLLLTVATMAAMGSAFSKSKHVFFMAALLDKGILKKYLDAHCTENNYKLCKYKDSLPGIDIFMWDERSPLYKEGGWQTNRTEYKAIISDIMRRPEYLFLFAEASIKFTVRQLCFFIIGEGNINVSNVYDRVKKYVPHEFRAFDTSKQNQWTLMDNIAAINSLFNAIIICSVAALIILLALKRKKLSRPIVLLSVVILAAIIINAWDCATFSTALGRYQCRVVWLIPFLVLLILFNRRTPGEAVR